MFNISLIRLVKSYFKIKLKLFLQFKFEFLRYRLSSLESDSATYFGSNGGSSFSGVVYLQKTDPPIIVRESHVLI